MLFGFEFRAGLLKAYREEHKCGFQRDMLTISTTIPIVDMCRNLIYKVSPYSTVGDKEYIFSPGHNFVISICYD